MAGRLTLWQLGLGGAPVFLTSDGHGGCSWVPDEGTGAILHLTTDCTITDCLLPSASSQAYGVAVSSDGSAWVVEMAANDVVRVSLSGQITSCAACRNRAKGRWTSPRGPTASSGSRCRPGTLSAGSPAAGLVSVFPVPGPTSSQGEITTGTYGALWFTEFARGAVGPVSVSGAVQSFPTTVTSPNLIVAGPDGYLWFSASGSNEIDKITPSGTVTEVTATGAFP